MTKEELYVILEDYIEEDFSSLSEEDDLTDLGVDSMAFMAITEELRMKNIHVTFMDLVEEATIAAWLRKIQQKTKMQ